MKPVLLFVLGFGRSGSSALARVLSLSGAALPGGLLGATADNPRGFWEPRAVIHLNQAILWRMGSSGYDPSLHVGHDGVLGDHENSYWIGRIKAYLLTLPAAPVVVIKEPKLTAVCGMWLEAARQVGFDATAVVAVRHPQQVIGSLIARAHRQKYLPASPELISATWLKFSLLAERYTRATPRVFVEYSNLLDDWSREVDRIEAALAINLDNRDGDAIDGFLSPDLWHHRYRGAVTEPFGTNWISVVYESLHAAAADQPWDVSALDRVFDAYHDSGSGFQTVFTDYQRYRTLNRFLRPSIVKLGLGALALAHRRRGTWA